jgi:hypothetical protein
LKIKRWVHPTTEAYSLSIKREVCIIYTILLQVHESLADLYQFKVRKPLTTVNGIVLAKRVSHYVDSEEIKIIHNLSLPKWSNSYQQKENMNFNTKSVWFLC